MEKVNVEYVIPESKKDITIEKWIAFEKIANVENTDKEFLDKKMLQIFCDVPLKYSMLMKASEISEMMNAINDVFSSPAEMQHIFKYNDVEYGLIPNFSDDITAGALIDLENYASDKDWCRMLSILYRPITKKIGNYYEIEPYTGTHLKFLQLGYDVLEGVLSFFLRGYQIITDYTLKSTLKQVKMMKNLDSTTLEKVNSLLNGVHIPKLYGC